MNKINGNEEFRTPILLLFLFSMLFVFEVLEVVKNIEAYGSIILSEPILFADDLFETITRICWFLIPFALLFGALKEKNLFLKLTYSLGSIPLFLTNPVINNLGFKSLYGIKIFIIFSVIMLLMKYLINTTDLYKRALREENKTDNQAAQKGQPGHSAFEHSGENDH